MNIERVKISKIKANKANPRVIKDDKFHKLVDSILALPKMLELRPIVVANDMTTLGGNMRFKALRSIKDMDCDEVINRLKKVPDFKKKNAEEKAELEKFWLGWKADNLVPIVKADELSDAEQKEFIIKDNTSFGEWDWDALANEWDEEDLGNWGLDVWQTEEPAKIEGVSADDAGEEDDFSDEEAENAVRRSKMGDIWQLGNHRLMCGDSTSLEQVAALMDGEDADLWITDPPYNVAYEGGTKDKLTIQNDNMSDGDFFNFLKGAYAAANSVMKAGAAFYIWHADSEGYNFRKACREVDWKVRETLIWNKNSMVMGRQDYQWKHEPCLYGWKEGASHKWYSDRKQTTIINCDKPLRSEIHPTMKPVALFCYQIRNSSAENDVVLDTFGGSGTTIICCEQLNRRGRSMELDPKYCDAILARWEKFTGKEAVLLKNINDTGSEE